MTFQPLPPKRRLPSSYWNGLDDIPYPPQSLLKFLSQFDANVLRQIASSLRCGLSCEVSQQFAYGSQNMVKEIIFQDEVVWIARCYYREMNPSILRSEVITMKYVKEHTAIPVPKVYHYDTSNKNLLGCQFIIMEAIFGSPRCRGPSIIPDVPENKRDSVFAQLSDYQLQLNALRFPAIGSINMNEDGLIFLDTVYRATEHYLVATAQPNTMNLLQQHSRNDLKITLPMNSSSH